MLSAVAPRPVALPGAHEIPGGDGFPRATRVASHTPNVDVRHVRATASEEHDVETVAIASDAGHPRGRIGGVLPCVVDLFAGAGGTGLGFANACFRIAAAVEKSPHAARTYAANLGVPVAPRAIEDVAPDALRRELGLAPYALDVLVGCPPCQGFTRLRNGSGASDHRNVLALRYLAFVVEFRPRFAVFENVPGLLRTVHGRAFYGALLAGFRALEYTVAEHLVDAADFGVPQHRERAIVIAARNGETPPTIEPTHGDPESEAVRAGRRPPWRTVHDAIGRLSRLRPGEQDASTPNHVAPRTGLRKDGARLRDFLTRVPLDGGNRSDVPREYWTSCHLEHDGHSDVYGRLAWAKPANTITTGCTNPSKGRFTHPEQNRGLTFREAAALQSFPRGFVFYGDCIAEQIGNAVPPHLAYVIAMKLRAALADPAPIGPTPAVLPDWIQATQPGALPQEFAGAAGSAGLMRSARSG